MSPEEVTAIPPLPRPRDWPRSSAEKVGTALAEREEKAAWVSGCPRAGGWAGGGKGRARARRARPGAPARHCAADALDLARAAGLDLAFLADVQVFDLLVYGFRVVEVHQAARDLHVARAGHFDGFEGQHQAPALAQAPRLLDLADAPQHTRAHGNDLDVVDAHRVFDGGDDAVARLGNLAVHGGVKAEVDFRAVLEEEVARRQRPGEEQRCREENRRRVPG